MSAIAVFDAASFYGHHEDDLGIAGMFGGFGAGFYKAYHKLIPKKPGHEERIKLYQLFHYMNHWYVINLNTRLFGFPLFYVSLTICFNDMTYIVAF